MPAPYREPARPSARCADLGVEPSADRRACSLLGALAGTCMAFAPFAGIELSALTGAATLAALARHLRARRARRDLAYVVAFLGTDEPLLTPSGWTSRDGTRRVRAREDAALAFEERSPALDLTLASHHVRLLVGPTAPRLELSLARDAVLHGRALEDVCFEGLPASLGGHPRACEARAARVELMRDGVRVQRFDGRGASAGCTMHESLSAARAQLAYEHGSHFAGLATLAASPTPAWEGHASGTL